MHLAYLIAAAVGCTVLIAQVSMQLLGLGGGDMAGHDLGGPDVGGHGFGGDDFGAHDGAHDGASDAAGHAPGETNFFFGVLSFKTLAAFVAFFGLTGLACEEMGIASGALSLLLSSFAGLSAGALVVILMRLLVSLNSSGTIKLEDAVGKTASVSLSVPAGGAKQGKIVVDLGGREVEVLAITNGPEIPTGAAVEVVLRSQGDTFEVVRV